MTKILVPLPNRSGRTGGGFRFAAVWLAALGGSAAVWLVLALGIAAVVLP